MVDLQARKHFSMIRGFQLADLFTLANGACGDIAIFQAMKYLGTHVQVLLGSCPSSRYAAKCA